MINSHIHVGIIVVSYHNPKMTTNYVRRELSKLKTPYTLIVVNNDATEEESKALAHSCGISFYEGKYISSKGCVICSKQNIGYAKGNILGVNILESHGVKCSHYLFSNDDIEIKDNNILDELCQSMALYGDCAGIGPRVIGLDGCDQSPHMRYISPIRQIGWKLFPFFRKKAKNKKTHQAIINDTKEVRTCYWVSGAYMLVDANKYMQVGGFDSRTFLYFEEAILAERFIKYGYRFYFAPSVSIVHFEGGSSKSINKKRIEEESRILYYKEYKNEPSFVIWLYHMMWKYVS